MSWIHSSPRCGLPRALLCSLLLLVAASTLSSQQPPLTIAVVLSRDVPPYREALRGFDEMLEESQRPYRIYEFIADGVAAERGTLVKKIRARQPDLILTVGSVATKMITEEVHDLPIVFSMVLTTAGNRSLEEMRLQHPNLTGVSMEIPVATQFEELKRLLPSTQRIGVLFDPEVSATTISDAAASALALGLQLVPLPVSSETDLVAWTDSLSRDVDVLWSIADSTVFSSHGLKHVLLETLRHRVPFVGLSPSFVKAGALLAFSTNYRDLGQQAARQSLEILDGAPAGTVPMAAPRSLKLSINLNTARQIRVEFDDDTRSKADVYF